jgi:hypothetical protein
MKRMIIIFSLFLAAPVFADEPKYPVIFTCQATNNVALEEQFCADLGAALAKTGKIDFDTHDDAVFFHIIVLPTARDNYLAASIAVNFIYPPLDGLALSAYTSIFLIDPGGVEEGNLDTIADRILLGVSHWVVWAKDKVGRIRVNKPVEMEALND